MQRVFVITDERCGGTQLGNIFEKIGYSVMDDPQTEKPGRDISVHNKQFVLNNLNYLYKKYNYVKICAVSYTVEEYITIIGQAVDLGCKIVFLWRQNYLERALSKAIAERTGVWHTKDKKKLLSSFYEISIPKLELIIRENKHKINQIKGFLDNNMVWYYPIMYEGLYKGSTVNRYKILVNLLRFIDPHLEDSIDESIEQSIKTCLDPSNRLNSIETYKKIMNIRKVVQKLSCRDNGFIRI